MLIFNSGDMKSFFEGFDYIDYKYGPLLAGLEKDNPELAKYAPIIKKGCVRFERSKDHNLYEKIDYAQIRDSIKLIYSDLNDADDYVFFYDFSLGYLIDRYIGIHLLNKLFSYHYFEYEWEQHVDMNFKKNELSFYRDHVIHEIRNCYMIMRYLDYGKENSKENNRETYYKKIERTLKVRSNRISKYACAQVEQYAAYLKKSIRDETMRGIFAENEEKIRELFGDGKIQSGGGSRLGRAESELMAVSNRLCENAEDFAWNYLIRGSLVVAALFHDIGYPVSYAYKGNRRINEYISLISPSDNVGFDTLNNLLQGSLLFTITDAARLKVQYDNLDHGALSAYMLLLQFYQTGAINGLDPIKRAIIELAAVVIYDHTLKYEISGLDEKDKWKCDVREKPSFADNPLSFTLRFVDDIQEWDRLYFETHGGGEYLFCRKCKMPMVSVWDDFLMKDILKPSKSPAAAGPEDGLLDCACALTQKRIYICGCGGSGLRGQTSTYDVPYFSELKMAENTTTDTVNFHRIDTGCVESGALFQSQRINYVITCEDVILLSDERKGDLFYVEYNPYRQLYLLTISHEALSYRIKEMSKVPKQFAGQTEIDINSCTRITDNPMMLKMRVICDYIFEVGAYIRQNREGGQRTYGRNMLYFDMLKSHFKTGQGTDGKGDFGLLNSFISRLWGSHFLPYDYFDAGITSERYTDFDFLASLLGSGIRNPPESEYEKIYKLLCAVSRETVGILIGSTESDNFWPTYKRNLVNTLNCYFKILLDYVSYLPLGKPMYERMKSEESVLRKWFGGKNGYEKFEVVEKEYCGFAHIDETHKTACKVIFRDFVSQLYYQSIDEMQTYYDLRANAKKEQPAKWDDVEYVVGEEKMKEALGVVFDTRYYCPEIINNIEVNKIRFDFFDVHSDMYLYNGMYRFTADNRKRRQ